MEDDEEAELPGKLFARGGGGPAAGRAPLRAALGWTECAAAA